MNGKALQIQHKINPQEWLVRVKEKTDLHQIMNPAQQGIYYKLALLLFHRKLKLNVNLADLNHLPAPSLKTSHP